MTYKTQLNKAIEKSGRSRKWLSKQLEIDPSTFWRKVQADTFTTQEKETLNTLLT